MNTYAIKDPRKQNTMMPTKRRKSSFMRKNSRVAKSMVMNKQMMENILNHQPNQGETP